MTTKAFTTNIFIFICVLLFACSPAASLASADNENLAGSWEGVLEVSGQRLSLIIHLKDTSDGQTGLMDSPNQNAYGVIMSKVSFANNKLLFEIKSMGIHYEGTFNKEKNTLEGNFIQGQPYKLNFSRKNQSATENVIKTSSSNNFNDIVGTWSGDILIPSSPLAFVIHVNQNKNATLNATADSPDQNAFGLKVDSISFSDGILKFSLLETGITYEGKLLADSAKIHGAFRQKGAEFPLNFSLGAVEKK